MKSKMITLAVLIVIFFLQSCIPSLHPIYTADKLVMLDQLPGKWVNDADDDELKISVSGGISGQPETWDFRQGENNNYLLIHSDEKGASAAFDVHIIKLGKHYFMDFFPEDLPCDEVDHGTGKHGLLEKENSFLAYHLLPVHTFAKIELQPGHLKISMFDPDFLKKILESGQYHIKHEKVDASYVLTASPEELQKFAEKYADEKAAFLDGPIELKIKP